MSSRLMNCMSINEEQTEFEVQEEAKVQEEDEQNTADKSYLEDDDTFTTIKFERLM